MTTRSTGTVGARMSSAKSQTWHCSTHHTPRTTMTQTGVLCCLLATRCLCALIDCLQFQRTSRTCVNVCVCACLCACDVVGVRSLNTKVLDKMAKTAADFGVTVIWCVCVCVVLNVYDYAHMRCDIVSFHSSELDCFCRANIQDMWWYGRVFLPDNRRAQASQ